LKLFHKIYPIIDNDSFTYFTPNANTLINRRDTYAQTKS
jgi:hypothetical protein